MASPPLTRGSPQSRPRRRFGCPLHRGAELGVPLRPPGAVELWELEEDESLIVNKFCKYEHDDIVSSVSVLAGSSQAVSGGRDFW